VQEFDYWMQRHTIGVKKNGREYLMARYNCEDAGPRPESYYEDYEVRKNSLLSRNDSPS